MADPTSTRTGGESAASRRSVRRFDRARAAIDRGLYALFSRHADRERHERDRRHYRGAAIGTGFDLYVARTYGLSWIAFAAVGIATAWFCLVVPDGMLAAVAGFLTAGLPVGLPVIDRPRTAVAAGGAAGLLGKHLTVRLRGRALVWTAAARRGDIERTLPGAVRYLRALADGADDGRGMLRTVADREAYGETARSFERVLARAELTGSLDSGLRMVARDTPSRDLLSPFLLKFREHAQQGEDALANYLRLESRMLSHRQARARQRAQAFMELLAEVFIVLLVLPSLLVLVVTVMAVLAPGLSAPVPTPLERITVTVRTVVVYGAVGFVLVIGAVAAALVERIRPPDQAPPTYEPPGGLDTLATVASNPASAAVVLAPVALAVAVALSLAGVDPANVGLLAYATYGLPVGAVAVRRTRRDDAKDRELKDFVHAVAGHVSLGRPFGEAVERVARDVDLGPLQADVDDLAFHLGLTTGVDGAVRADALKRFVDRVGTPLAGQTIGLVTGALDVGSDAEDVFETLQTEIGRLYHERKALRSAMLVYVAVGWTTALLIVGITVAANQYVLDGFAQLTAVGEAAVAIAPDAVDPARDRYRFYLVTQATMLACGWFAGAANRGRYDALFHSAALVATAYLVFAGVGMV